MSNNLPITNNESPKTKFKPLNMINMKKAILASGAMLLASVLPSFAQGPFNIEEKYYITASVASNSTAPTQLYEGTLGSTTLTPIGTATVSYNASGFNPADNYIYGLSRNNLVRIANDGSVTNLGQVTGITQHVNWAAATFLPNGDFIVRNFTSPAESVYRININTRTATILSSSLTARIGDLTYDKVTEKLFSVYTSTNELISIDPVTGSVTVIGNTTLETEVEGMFSDADGNIYAVASNNIYSIDKATGAPAIVSSFTN